MMEKTFDPAAVESRIASEWEAAGAFRSGRPERASAAPYTIVIPPPNVTGSLHMGHALNNTLQDILCRFERMRGKDVLWQPGTDHAGIATQMVVERRLASAGEPSRRDLGREKFLEKVWEWKAESGGAIVNQLKRLGASCDWSRERFTMDPGSSKAVLKAFVELYRAGPDLQGQAPGQLGPEAADGGVRHRGGGADGQGLALAFQLPDRRRGGKRRPTNSLSWRRRGRRPCSATAPWRCIQTTSATPICRARKCCLPLVGRLIPIVADAYSDPEKGSGAVKITPAHDFNDFEVGAAPQAAADQHPGFGSADPPAGERGVPRRRDRERRPVPDAGEPARTFARGRAESRDRPHGGARADRDHRGP